MKILHIIQGVNKEQTGLVFALVSLLKMEKHLGISSDVLSLELAHPPREQVMELANEVHLFPPSFPKRFYRSQLAVNWLEAHAKGYDLIQLHSVWNALVIECAHVASKSGTPYAVWPHGSIDGFDLKKKRLLKKMLGPLIMQPVLKKAQNICFTADREIHESCTYGAEIDPVVLPLPIEMTGVEPIDDSQKHEIRAKWGIQPDDFMLLFLSRIDYKKGLNLIFPALNELIKKYPHVKLLIAGDYNVPYMKLVTKWIDTYNLHDQVILPGFLSGTEKNQAFGVADCFVLPSLNENFGIAVVESLFRGLPVVISDNVYIHEEINGKGGWVCEYSVEDFQQILENIIENPAEIRQMSDLAKSTADQFSIKQLSAVYQNYYRSFEPATAIS